MGHYDDCYAADDFSHMSKKEKAKCYPQFQKKLEEQGSVHGTFDDVYGHILWEWATENGFKIKRGYKDLTVYPPELIDLAEKAVNDLS